MDKTTGEIRNTYTIVTTKAIGIMKEIHNSKNRMPITLRKERDWLNALEINDFYKDTVDIIATPLI
ncbi:MAG: SOS response-associated peptidase family protein [Bacteroidota bacterium]